MSRSRLLVAMVLALIAVGGCSSPGKSSSDPTARPTSRTSTPTLGEPVRLGAAIGSPVLKDSRLFYPFTDVAHGTTKGIASADLSTGKRTRLVSTRLLAGGSITEIALSGWIVYAEEAGRGEQAPGRARWAVGALDPSTGQHTVLMEGGPDVQGPELTGGREATWVVFPGGTPKAYSWAPKQGAPRRADAMPGDASECTPPTANQELVTGCSHRGDWWAWSERAKPGHGVTDDPAYLYLSGPGTRVTVARLGFATSAPLLLEQYLLWEGRDGLHVTALDDPGSSTVVAEHGSFVASTDGRSAAVVDEGATAATARLLHTS